MTVDRTMSEVREEVERFVQRERSPYTQDHYVFENVAKLRNQELQEQLLVALNPVSGEFSDVDALMNAASLKTIVSSIFERNQRKSVEEHMSEDMEHALNAYGKVAMKRFIDVVPMHAWEIYRGFPDLLKQSLSEKDLDDRQLERLIQDGQDFLLRRSRLEATKRELDEGVSFLDELDEWEA